MLLLYLPKRSESSSLVTSTKECYYEKVVDHPACKYKKICLLGGLAESELLLVGGRFAL